MLDGIVLTISLQQIILIAIIPVLTQILSAIVSSLTNTDVFGHYEIAKLFITGSLFKIQDFNKSYHYIVVTEARKICRKLIRENTYRTKVDININTSREETMTARIPARPQKSFFYDMFLKGELRIVSSSEYMTDLSHLLFKNGSSTFRDCPVNVSGVEGSSCIIHQGKELFDKRIQVRDIFCKFC